MSEIIFNDKNSQPTDEVLAETLGDNFQYWQEIKKSSEELCGSTTEEWKFYGKNYGWQLKTLFKKRNLYFLIPYESYFKIVFIFGDKAVQKIEKSDVSEKIKNDLRNAKKYMEGRGIGLEIKDGDNIPDIENLLLIKLNI